MLLTLSSRLVQFAVMFLTVRVMTTVLNPNEYGKVAIITAITAFFAFFFINPIGTYINRHLNGWNMAGNLRTVFLQYSAYLIIVSGFAFIVVNLANRLDVYPVEDALLLAVLVAVTLFFATANQTLIPSLNILGQSVAFSWFTIVTALSTLLGAVVFTALFKSNAIAWLGGVVFGQAILSIVAWVYFSKSHSLGWSSGVNLQRKNQFLRKPVLDFALPVALSAAFVWMHLHGYRLVLGELISLAELGLFAAGYALAIQLMSAIELILNTWFQPVFYRSCDSHSSKVRDSAWATYACNIWLPATLAALALFSGAPLFVKLMLGENYQNTVQYVQFGALVEFARILVGVTGLYFHQHRQTKKLILPSMAGALVAIPLIWFLVPDGDISLALLALFAGSLLSFAWLVIQIPQENRLSFNEWLVLMKGGVVGLLLVVVCKAVQLQISGEWFWVWFALWSVAGVIYLRKRLI